MSTYAIVTKYAMALVGATRRRQSGMRLGKLNLRSGGTMRGKFVAEPWSSLHQTLCYSTPTSWLHA